MSHCVSFGESPTMEVRGAGSSQWLDADQVFRGNGASPYATSTVLWLNDASVATSRALSSGSSDAFEHPCEAHFEYLAEHQPARLFDWVRSGGLSPGDLTHAAEACGRVLDRKAEALGVLAELLSDPSSLVREGAVYGLQRLGQLPPAVERRLRQLTLPKFEQSAGVRDAAQDALEDLLERD